jgi:hypothetical protein
MAESESGFQDAVNKLHEKEYENTYETPVKAPSGFGEVSYG